MSVYNSKQPQMDLEVEAKESADQWKATFDVTGKFLFVERFFYRSSYFSHWNYDSKNGKFQII